MTLAAYLPVCGTIQCATLVLGPGGVIDAASGTAGRMTYAQTLILPVTAVANTDFTMSVPPGCILHSAMVYTSIAYTGATATIQIGNAAAGAQYVAAVSIAAIGIVNLTLLAAQAPAFLSMPAEGTESFYQDCTDNSNRGWIRYLACKIFYIVEGIAWQLFVAGGLGLRMKIK